VDKDTIRETIIIRQTIIGQRQSISASFLNRRVKWKKKSANASCMPGNIIEAGTSLFSKRDRSCPTSEPGWFSLKYQERERLRSNYLNTNDPRRQRPAFNQRLHRKPRSIELIPSGVIFASYDYSSSNRSDSMMSWSFDILNQPISM